MKTSRNRLSAKKPLANLDQFINNEIGHVGSEGRKKFENDCDALKLGVLLQEARQKRKLTQEQVAALAGTKKSDISKLEKDMKDIRFSTLQRIITEGLGGHLRISINLTPDTLYR